MNISIRKIDNGFVVTSYVNHVNQGGLFHGADYARPVELAFTNKDDLMAWIQANLAD